MTEKVTYERKKYLPEWESKWIWFVDIFHELGKKLYSEKWSEDLLGLSRDGNIKTPTLSDLQIDRLYTVAEFKQIEQEFAPDDPWENERYPQIATHEQSKMFFTVFDKICLSAAEGVLKVLGKSDDGFFDEPNHSLWTGDEIEKCKRVSIIHSQLKERLPNGSGENWRVWDVRFDPASVKRFLAGSNSNKQRGGQTKFPYREELKQWIAEFYEETPKAIYMSAIHYAARKHRENLDLLCKKYGKEFAEKDLKRFPSDSWFKNPQNKNELLADIKR
jgi:hypothetical protein